MGESAFEYWPGQKNASTAAALTIGIVVLLGIPACDRSITKDDRSFPSTTNDISFPLDDFTLTERGGGKLSKADLRGRVWIASFVFTRCTGPCPQVTATMARLQSELAHEKDVRFVTFTVDPDRDDPAELRKYAEHFRADKERWLFLTGEEKELHRLLKEGFKVPIYRNSATKEVGKEFDHSSRLVVVDRHGQLRGYFDGFANVDVENSHDLFERNLQRLKAKVADLLKEE